MEDLAYRRLLDLAYTTESPLPVDIHTISRLINMREFKREIEDVLNEFFVLVGEGWINNRVLKEMEATGAKSLKASNAAKARWEKQNNAKSMQTLCLPDASSTENNAPSKENDATQDTGHRTQDKPKRKRSALCTIQDFLDQCREDGVERIPKDDPVFEFAENTGIPLEMIKTTWQQFVRNNRETKKRQKDWRATFRNCVRGNWYKFWFIEADGTVKETSQYRAMKKDLGDNHVQ